MLFNSIQFLIFFPTIVALYFLLPAGPRWVMLLVASFYFSYGYRVRDAGERSQDVVIVGDSLTVGSGLTQDDTLAPVLSARSGYSVYPLAPADMNTFIRERRFQESPPKVVIVQYVERVVRGDALPAR